MTENTPVSELKKWRFEIGRAYRDFVRSGVVPTHDMVKNLNTRYQEICEKLLKENLEDDDPRYEFQLDEMLEFSTNLTTVKDQMEEYRNESSQLSLEIANEVMKGLTRTANDRPVLWRVVKPVEKQLEALKKEIEITMTTTSMTKENETVDIAGKVPKIKEFDGKAGSWPRFKKTIHYSIIDNPSIRNNRIKFQYIYNALPPEARRYIETMDDTEPNFEQIVGKLDQVYGASHLTLNELNEGIAALPYLKPMSQYDDLVKYHEVLTSINVSTLNSEVKNILAGKILGSMHPIHRHQAHRLVKEKEDEIIMPAMTVTHLLTYVTNEMRIGMMVNQTSGSAQLRSNANTKPRNVLAMTPDLNCMYCEERHRHPQCPMSVEKKIEVLQKKQRCYACAGKGHSARDCSRDLKCGTCGGKHLTYLCQQGKKEDNCVCAVSSQIENS